MLSTADVSIREVLRYFTQRGIDVGLVVPTDTGLGKGIMDATANMRQFLRDAGIHDFDHQPQGEEHKRRVRTRVVTSTGIVDTTTSFYRPVTKHGDPRLWVYGLKKYAQAGNLLVFVAMGPDDLLVINASSAGLVPGVSPPLTSRIQIRDAIGVDLDALLAPLLRDDGSPSSELLAMLKEIAGRWHVGKVGKRRDTEVGRLLEELLGIKANSSKKPDYKGIEIKASRKDRGTKQGLFCQVPNWRISALKSSNEMLDAFGYARSEDYERELRCTVSAKKPNSQGLALKLARGGAHLVETSTRPSLPEVVAWEIEALQKALQNKHPETFWVAASSRRDADVEEFRYEHVLHTKRPMLGALPALLETGVVTVDHLITREVGGRAHEKGPSFKIGRRDIGLLFPPGVFHVL